MITRISKLKGFDNVILGRDLANVFKEGHVYSVDKILGEIVVHDLGEHALMDNFEGHTIGQVATDGSYCLTHHEKAQQK